MTVPVTRADVSDSVAKLTGPVPRRGAPVVTKVASAPRVVPSELVATSRKWYVTPGPRFGARLATTGAARSRACVPRGASSTRTWCYVPYSKYHDVERPFGFTVPPSVADVGPTEVAATRDARSAGSGS